MNDKEARFMRVKRMSESQVSALHDAERAADERWREHRDDPSKRGDGWEIVGVQKLVELERVMPPFWESRVAEDVRARAIAVFLASPSVRRAFAMLDAADKSEMESTHAADWLVWKRAPIVGTLAGEAVRAGGAER